MVRHGRTPAVAFSEVPVSIRQRLPFIPVLLALILAGTVSGASRTAIPELPARLTDQEFWRLTADLSEPNGAFRSENLLSNEMAFAVLLPEVLSRTKPGGVYMGVGPEQNFTYIAGMKPRMAFITDVRRGNLHVLLMYKALFELSANRAEFVSRLFTKPRPATLTATSSVADIMDTYWEVTTGDEKAFAANLDAVMNNLTKTHALPLDAEDRDGVSRSYRAFYAYGPGMNYSATTSLGPLSGGNAATYRDLMKQIDANGKALTYLASEASFGVVKDLFSKNLIVPLVGNFSGPKTIRAIGDYVRAKGATVTAFYLSSVEPYLRRDGTQPVFCANAATLPITESSIFIRTGAGASMPVPAGTPAVRIGSYQNGAVGPMLNGCGAPATSSWQSAVRRAPLALR